LDAFGSQNSETVALNDQDDGIDVEEPRRTPESIHHPPISIRTMK
jgi:hypothetical protein